MSVPSVLLLLLFFAPPIKVVAVDGSMTAHSFFCIESFCAAMVLDHLLALQEQKKYFNGPIKGGGWQQVINVLRQL